MKNGAKEPRARGSQKGALRLLTPNRSASAREARDIYGSVFHLRGDGLALFGRVFDLARDTFQ